MPHRRKTGVAEASVAVAAPPETDEAKLKALYSYDILETVFEAAFDDVADIARWITGAPIGLISLADQSRQWFRTSPGLEARETARDGSFCAYAIQEAQLMVVPDARQDARFADIPMVTSAPNVRFYAGVKLATRRGANLGTLCVIDRRARELSAGEHLALDALGRLTASALELRGVVSIIRRHGDEIMDGDAAGRVASELLVRPLIHFWERMSVLPRRFSLRAGLQMDASEPALALVLKELDEQTGFIHKLSHAFQRIVENPDDRALMDQPRELIRKRFPLADWAAGAERDYVETARRHAETGAAEAERLAELANAQALNASPDAEHDMILRLAALLFGTPIAAISVADDEACRFKVSIGFEPGQTRPPCGFCAHMAAQDDIMVVLDARSDARFRDDALATGPTKIRFYAAAILRSSAGEKLGALCVMSPQSRRHFSQESQAKLKVLAWLTSSQLELRRTLADERAIMQQMLAAGAGGAQITASNVNAEFLELMAAVARGDFSNDEVMAVAMKAWNEHIRASTLLNGCLRSLRETLGVSQYERFTSQMHGFGL